MEIPSHRLQTAVQLFDAANAKDPHFEIIDGEERPRELIYAQRLTEWILKLCANPSEPLLLAARSQHIRRWEIPRNTYPEGRAGYLKWRADLKVFHARVSGELLAQAGYDDATIERVQSLNLKKDFPNDPDSRVLEDALCLVFLEYQLTDMVNRMTEEKLVNALRKSWNKMTPEARTWAGRISFSDREKTLIAQALETHS